MLKKIFVFLFVSFCFLASINLAFAQNPPMPQKPGLPSAQDPQDPKQPPVTSTPISTPSPSVTPTSESSNNSGNNSSSSSSSSSGTSNSGGVGQVLGLSNTAGEDSMWASIILVGLVFLNAGMRLLKFNSRK